MTRALSSAPHRIRSQRWEARAPDRDTAFALRAQLRRDVDDVLLPALAQAFDAAVTGGRLGDEVVRIPRLAVKLRVRNLDALAAALADELPALIAEQLDAALVGRAHDVREMPRRLAATAQRRASLMHYLQGGQLDWPDMQGEPDAQAAALREDAVALAHSWRVSPATLRGVMPATHEAVVAFFFRLLQLLPEAVRADWLQAMLDAAPVPATPMHRRMLNGLRDLPTRRSLSSHSLLHVQAVTLAVAVARGAPEVQALLQVLAALPGINAIGMDVLAELIRGSETALHVADGQGRPPIDIAPAGNASQGRTDTHGETHAGDHVPRAAIDPATGLPASIPPGVDVPPASPLPATPPVADDTVVMRVQAAGLVLAHPFLPGLLAARGLLDEDGKTLPAHHLPRAAALLHWLARGREEVLEFELGLIKPLLGLRPADALLLGAGLLDDGDREECTALLEAMISHWPALRSTSVEGLRVSFLQRQGLLRESSNSIQPGWQLQLEPESFDMLLAQLPWSISIVRLPWMTRPIFTDWPTR